MSEDLRNTVIDILASEITVLQFAHPTRVAVEGRSAAGKTTLADALAAAILLRGRDVLRASIDDFHRPDHKGRSQRGEWTPRTYYDEGYDYTAFRDLALHPLGPHGSRRCLPARFDALHDTECPEVWHTVAEDTIAIIDGVFLLRPELATHWDYVIWLDIDMETMVERARRRDVAWVGSEQVVEAHYRRHWVPTHELYERLERPRERAHVVIDNRALSQPRVLRLSRS